MQATLAELATLVDGELIGNGEVLVDGAAPLGSAGPGQITLIDRADRRDFLAQSGAVAAVAPRAFVPNGLPIIRVDDIHRAFAKIVSRFRPPRLGRLTGISPLAAVSPSAKIGSGVVIHPYATIGDDVEIGEGAIVHSGVHILAGSTIGAQVVIFPNAVLYENSVVGPRSVIHANAVVGAYGFGYSRVDGRHQLSAQLGNVVIEADVERRRRHHDQPWHLRAHRNRRGDEDRQSGDDRSQLPYRPSQHSLRRWALPAARRRAIMWSWPDRPVCETTCKSARTPSWARWRASSATCRPALAWWAFPQRRNGNR